MSVSVQVSSLQLRLSAAQQSERSEWRSSQTVLQSTLSEVRAQVKDADAGVLVGRVGELQGQLLQCQKENMELRFELEQAVTSVPRMKVPYALLSREGLCVVYSYCSKDSNTLSCSLYCFVRLTFLTWRTLWQF